MSKVSSWLKSAQVICVFWTVKHNCVRLNTSVQRVTKMYVRTVITDTLYWIMSYFYYMGLKVFGYGNLCGTSFNTPLHIVEIYDVIFYLNIYLGRNNYWYLVQNLLEICGVRCRIVFDWKSLFGRTISKSHAYFYDRELCDA